MKTTQFTVNSTTNRFNTFLLLVLALLGFSANYFRYPIFFNIDFIFGSIFSMLVLQFYGLRRGAFVAAIIASCTYFIWNHPYAIVIQTAEVVLVGWLMNRRKTGMLLADTLYWFFIGIPLVYLFYHVFMHSPNSSTTITIMKQAVNGIANSLVARLIFMAYTLRSRSSLISYREIVSCLLASFVLFPILILLAVDSKVDFSETDNNIKYLLMQNSQREATTLETWVANRKTAITNLGDMATSKSPRQLQSFLEEATKSDKNFKRIGLYDKDAITTAFFPLTDELGHSNIGKSFTDRPFIPQLKKTLQPILSEVVLGRIGIPRPIVLMIAPVVIRGEYGGYVAGILSLDQVRNSLESSTKQNGMFYTLLDKNGKVIMTNRKDQSAMMPFKRGKGERSQVKNGVFQ